MVNMYYLQIHSVLIWTFDANCQSVLEQEQQRICLLRKLSSFYVFDNTWTASISLFILKKNMPSFSFICWFIWLSMKVQIVCHFHFNVARKIISGFKAVFCNVAKSVPNLYWNAFIASAIRIVVPQVNLDTSVHQRARMCSLLVFL